MKNSKFKRGDTLTMIMATAFLFIFCSVGQAQNKANIQTLKKTYVRFEIGHGALHCPFLGPKFEAKLKEIKGIENFFLDKQESYLTFNLPANTDMTLESLKKIGVDAGYPPADVVVKMDIKPIKKIIVN